jgi:CTP:phosphocholine cytidylyltransferase-like protein
MKDVVQKYQQKDNNYFRDMLDYLKDKYAVGVYKNGSPNNTCILSSSMLVKTNTYKTDCSGDVIRSTCVKIT